MPVIGIPVTPADVSAPSRLVATPAHTIADAPCCDTFPATAAVPTLVSCSGLNVLATDPTQLFKKPLFGRIRTIRVQAGQEAAISWTMQNREGNPIKLTDCICEPTTESSLSSSESASDTYVVVEDCKLVVKFRMHEQAAPGSCRPPRLELPVTVVDADVGKVSISLPRDATLHPGIYFGEVAVLGVNTDGDEYVYFSNTFYLAIEQGQWAGHRARGAGPPTFAEIRLHLRDSSPEENLLLSDLMFDDAEITLAISRPVQYWNEIPPPVGLHTTQSFPYRYHWLEAIAGELFLMAAEGYRKNHLAYSAAGVAIDDQNKSRDYEEAALRRRTDWREFVKRKKAEINLEASYGSVGSDYRGRLSF